MTDQTQPLCWINGELLPAAAATISVLDHGLLYGDGVFEGIRFYRGRAFRLADHLRRLADSAAAICLQIPYQTDRLAQAVDEVIEAYGQPDGYLRLLVTRGEGALGLDPASCGRPNVVLIADRLTLVDPQRLQAGARVNIASTRRLPSDGLDPRIKSLNYLNQILARMEATRAGADEAILLNHQGRVAEGTADNLFLVRDGCLLTPPTIDGALAGITRQVIMELADVCGIECQEQSLTPYDLYTADELFLTGTGAELIPVAEVDGRPVKATNGVIFQRLSKAFQHATTV